MISEQEYGLNVTESKIHAPGNYLNMTRCQMTVPRKGFTMTRCQVTVPKNDLTVTRCQVTVPKNDLTVTRSPIHLPNSHLNVNPGQFQFDFNGFYGENGHQALCRDGRPSVSTIYVRLCNLHPSLQLKSVSSFPQKGRIELSNRPFRYLLIYLLYITNQHRFA